MALLRCPDCGRNVSSLAPACPGCGRPMKGAAPPIAAPPPAVTPVSQTSERMGGSDPNRTPYITVSVSPKQQRDKRRSANRIAFALVGLLVGLIAFAAYLQDTARNAGKPLLSNSANYTGHEPMPTYPTTAPLAGLARLKLTFRWNKAGFDNIMQATFEIQNDNDFAVKDITIQCTHFANSGTQIDSNTKTIYEVVPAKSAKTIRDFSMGFINSQVASTDCRAISLKPAN